MTTQPENWVRYIRQVAEFDRLQLLELIASVSSQQMDTSLSLSEERNQVQNFTPFQPFSLAAIARDVVLNGPKRGGRRPRLEDLERLCNRYLNLYDPIFSTRRTSGSFDRYTVRIAYEQFAFQLSPLSELARSWVLYSETPEMMHEPRLDSASWAGVLGCDLDDFIRTNFIWYIKAMRNNGWVDLEDLPTNEIIAQAGLRLDTDVKTVGEMLLTASFTELRNHPQNSKVIKGLEKYRFNPFEAKPYLRIAGNYLAPSLHLAAQRTWTRNLYYDRVREPGFTDALGPVFETYIGRQLRLLSKEITCTIYDKVIFDRGNGEEESIDWFVVFQELVLLVEVKSTRLTEESRLGLDRLQPDIGRTLGIAFKQLETTAQMMREGAIEFSHLPVDRPLLGLAVTLEPYWILGDQDLLPIQPHGIVAHPVSCGELEDMVSAGLAGPITSNLMKLVSDSRVGGRRFNSALSGLPKVDNPILDNAFVHLLGK